MQLVLVQLLAETQDVHPLNESLTPLPVRMMLQVVGDEDQEGK
jgi:hypothetical protein